MSSLPHWARKPKHKKEVIATPLGWMVKETGEYLKLVKNLDQKLASMKVELESSLESVVEDPVLDQQETSDNELQSDSEQDIQVIEPEIQSSNVHVEEEPQQETKRKRGRKSKNK